MTFIAFGLSTGCEEEVSLLAFRRSTTVTRGGVTGVFITWPFLPGWVFFMWRRKLSERRKLNKQMLHEYAFDSTCQWWRTKKNFY